MPFFETIVITAHVTLGTVAVGAGAAALASRKGRNLHIRAGGVFVYSMGVSSLLGGALGALRYETLWITFFAGILGATLVASGVLAARINAPGAKRWFVAVSALNALNAVGLFAAGWSATTMPDGHLYGFPAADYFFLFGMAAIAAAGDLRICLGRVVTNRHRIAQHLTRMCTGFFIAAGSAFTGPGASAFPEVVQRSGILSLPELIIVLLMLFWLWKTLRRSAVVSTKPTFPTA